MNDPFRQLLSYGGHAQKTEKRQGTLLISNIQYADDIQLYLSVPVHSTTLAVQRFSACVVDVNNWLCASRLRLNATKTQVMWLGSPQHVSQVAVSHVPVLSELIKVVKSACDLGVDIDSQLSYSAYVATLCRSGFHHLRQLRPIARSLSDEAAKQ